MSRISRMREICAVIENRRVAFFYRHLGPSGPEEAPPHPELLRCAQTALILHILIILAILLQTRERLRASRPLKSARRAVL